MGLDISGYLRSEETNYAFNNNNHRKYRWETDIKRTCIWTGRKDTRLMSWLYSSQLRTNQNVHVDKVRIDDEELERLEKDIINKTLPMREDCFKDYGWDCYEEGEYQDCERKDLLEFCKRAKGFIKKKSSAYRSKEILFTWGW